MIFKALDVIKIKLWVTSIGQECHLAEGQAVKNGNTVKEVAIIIAVKEGSYNYLHRSHNHLYGGCCCCCCC